MIRSLSMLKLGRFQPPVRRVLAIDAGSRSLRLLLAESSFGHLRIIRQELIDLHAEGLLTGAEVNAHLQTTLEEWGRPPLALVLPQHLSTSQVVDLPTAPESEVEKLIQNETRKLSGVSDTRIDYDFVRLESAVPNRQQFWVTICQEGELRDRINKLGLADEDICEVTTTANALINAYCAMVPKADRAILVHVGAQTTVLAIVLRAQGAFATSFQMGGDFLTRSLARIKGIPEEAAQQLKETHNLLTGPEAIDEFAASVDGWVAELKRQLNEWFAEHPALAKEVAAFRIAGSGTGFNQPGLADYLREQAGLDIQPWPSRLKGGGTGPDRGFEVAYGTVLQALGRSSQPVSLLPEDYLFLWKKRLSQQRLEWISLVLVMICVLLLAAGTWRKTTLIEQKSQLLDKTRAAQETFNANDALAGELAIEYETLRPLFVAEQNTRDVLKTLAALQQSRSNRSLWYVLVVDQQSYFSPPSSMVSTNLPIRPLAGLERASTGFIGPLLPSTTQAKPGCIAELTIPEQSENARAALTQVVNELKQEKVFSKVDSLSDDLRRNLADARVLLSDRHYALALEFAETDFRQPLPTRAKPLVLPRNGPRRSVVQGLEPVKMPSKKGPGS